MTSEKAYREGQWKSWKIDEKTLVFLKSKSEFQLFHPRFEHGNKRFTNCHISKPFLIDDGLASS
jgi:hypothetical protein